MFILFTIFVPARLVDSAVVAFVSFARVLFPIFLPPVLIAAFHGCAASVLPFVSSSKFHECCGTRLSRSLLFVAFAILHSMTTVAFCRPASNRQIDFWSVLRRLAS